MVSPSTTRQRSKVIVTSEASQTVPVRLRACLEHTWFIRVFGGIRGTNVCLLCPSGSQTSDSMDTIKEDVEPDLVQHYFVPTPFVLASCSVPSLPKRGLPPEGIACAQPHAAPSSNRAGHQTHWRPVAPPVPVEANVVVPPPPPTRPRDFSGRTAEPRGPLSYEALVYLRRSASTKKTPLCPKVDHTIDTDGPNLGPTSKPVRSCPEASKSKVAPPVVAPKPKRVPTSTCVKTPNPAPVTPDSPCGLKTLTDPEEVRLAALHKLGLLKESDSEAVAPPPSLRKCHSSAAPTPDRSNTHPSRSPSFCYSQAPPEAKSKPLQSSASFHHRPRSDQQSAPDPPSKPQATCLRPCATLDSHTHGRPRPEPVTKAPVAQPGAHKPSNAVGYTVMMVPGMGADRKEALRKLGLLKEQ